MREHGRDAARAARRSNCRRLTPSRIGEASATVGARTVVAWQSPSPPCSSPSTIPTRRSASTATRSASRSATTSPSDGFRWVTVGAPGQDVDIVLFQPHGGRSQTEGDALLSLVTQGVAAGCDLPLRRPRHHLREGPGVGRRGAPGAGVAALGRARLRVPRPVGQPRPHRAGLTARPECRPCERTWGAFATAEPELAAFVAERLQAGAVVPCDRAGERRAAGPPGHADLHRRRALPVHGADVAQGRRPP